MWMIVRNMRIRETNVPKRWPGEPYRRRFSGLLLRKDGSLIVNEHDALSIWSSDGKGLHVLERLWLKLGIAEEHSKDRESWLRRCWDSSFDGAIELNDGRLLA